MNIELILWILVGIVISEIIFICIMKRSKENKKENYSEYNSYFCDMWIVTKLISLLISGFFIFVNFILVYNNYIDTEGNFAKNILWGTGHYEYILYELLILAIIGLFFFLNKKISERILSDKK